MIDTNHLLLQSLVAPAVFSVIILSLGRGYGRRLGWIAFIPLVYSAAIYAYIGLGTPLGFIQGGLEASYPWAPYIGDLTLLADSLSTPIAFTVAILAALIAVYSMEYMGEAEHLEVYYALYLLYTVGMLGSVLSTNLAAFFLFFELMLLPSWALIGVWGTGPKERIAFKYFMFTEAGALSLLAGILISRFTYGTFDIFKIKMAAPAADRTAFTVAALILLGLFVKMAIFPLHTWLPDAHAEAPTPISALLSPAMIGIGGYAAIRIIYTAFPALIMDHRFIAAISILAVVTMFYGGFLALAQDDLKRLLAYSSISQMGYLLLGVASSSIIGVAGAVLLYMSHGFAKAVLFMVSGVFMHKYDTRRISDLGGLAGKMPYTATAALVSFLSLAGTPPLLGFWSEIFIFAGSMHSSLTGLLSLDMGKAWITALAVTATVLTTGYGLRAVRRIFFGREREGLRPGEAPSTMLAPIIILTVLSAILGIYPTPITSQLGTLLSKLIP
ncbi:MAG: complex I subunit 5 family protein [Candidatus Bathyarchaeia archaeon]